MSYTVHFSYLLGREVVRSEVCLPVRDPGRAYAEAERSPGYCALSCEPSPGEAVLRAAGPVRFDPEARTPGCNVSRTGFVSCDCPACGSGGEDLSGRSVHPRGHRAEQASLRLGGAVSVTCTRCGHVFRGVLA